MLLKNSPNSSNTVIELLDSKAIDTIDFSNFELKNYNFWPGLDAGMLQDQLKHNLRNYDGLIWTVFTKSKINALLAAKKLKWDSRFYGFECYKIDYLLADSTVDDESTYTSTIRLVENYFAFAKKNGIKFTYCSIDTSQRAINSALVEKKFFYLLTWIDGFVKSTEVTFNVSNSESGFGLINDHELDFFKTIAQKNYFKEGHFYLDSKFDKNLVNKMYGELVINSFKDKDILLVYRINNKPVGLFICKKIETYHYFNNLKVAPLRFLILDPDQRGKGLGYDFFCKTINYLKECSDIITTGLEVHNLPSLNLHSRLKFKFNFTHNLYHYWH